MPALIPAFDPRPGRTNVNFTQDIQVLEEPAAPPPAACRPSSVAEAPCLRLYLQEARSNEDAAPRRIPLDDNAKSLFYYVQRLQLALNPKLKQTEVPSSFSSQFLLSKYYRLQLSRKIWDYQYVLTYQMAGAATSEDAAMDTTASTTGLGDDTALLYNGTIKCPLSPIYALLAHLYNATIRCTHVRSYLHIQNAS